MVCFSSTIAQDIEHRYSYNPTRGVVSFYFTDTLNLAASEDISVHIQSPAGLHIFEYDRNSLKSDDGGSVLAVPYARAGLSPYTLYLGDEVAFGELNISPSPPISPLTTEVAGRSLQVTNVSQAAVYLSPLDIHGNVSDEPIDIELRYPNYTSWSSRVEMENLVGWTLVPHGEELGKIAVSVKSDEAFGERTEIYVFAGPLEQGNIYALHPQIEANPRDAWHLVAPQLQDRYDNPINDGTVFELYAEFGNIRITGTGIASSGRAQIDLPPIPETGEMALRLQSSHYRSEDVTLAVTAFTEQLHVAWLDDNTIRIGPILDSLGAYPDNGALVSLRLLNNEEQEIFIDEAALIGGVTQWDIPPLGPRLRPSELEVSFGGLRTRTSIP